jgi:hypothetical protein
MIILIESDITWRRYEEVTDGLERQSIMKLFVDRMLLLKISETAMLPGTQEDRMNKFHKNIRPVIYRILLTKKTGRYENG